MKIGDRVIATALIYESIIIVIGHLLTNSRLFIIEVSEDTIKVAEVETNAELDETVYNKNGYIPGWEPGEKICSSHQLKLSKPDARCLWIKEEDMSLFDISDILKEENIEL